MVEPPTTKFSCLNSVQDSVLRTPYGVRYRALKGYLVVEHLHSRNLDSICGDDHIDDLEELQSPDFEQQQTGNLVEGDWMTR